MRDYGDIPADEIIKRTTGEKVGGNGRKPQDRGGRDIAAALRTGSGLMNAEDRYNGNTADGMALDATSGTGYFNSNEKDAPNGTFGGDVVRPLNRFLQDNYQINPELRGVVDCRYFVKGKDDNYHMDVIGTMAIAKVDPESPNLSKIQSTLEGELELGDNPRTIRKAKEVKDLHYHVWFPRNPVEE